MTSCFPNVLTMFTLKRVKKKKKKKNSPRIMDEAKLGGSNLLCTTMFLEIPGTNFVVLGMMKG